MWIFWFSFINQSWRLIFLDSPLLLFSGKTKIYSSLRLYEKTSLKWFISDLTENLVWNLYEKLTCNELHKFCQKVFFFKIHLCGSEPDWSNYKISDEDTFITIDLSCTFILSTPIVSVAKELVFEMKTTSINNAREIYVFW